MDSLPQPNCGKGLELIVMGIWSNRIWHKGGRTVRKVVLAISIALLAILAASITSCSSTPEYPLHLAFPSRTDRLVLKVPETSPPGLGSPGKLESELAELDSRGGKTAEPTAIPMEICSALDQFLRECFGTPAAPTIQLTGDKELSVVVDQMGLSNDALTEGGRLFHKHCLGCHGLPGDGRGSAGLWLNPYPRDFRRGAFKFVTTGEGAKPRRSDLLRTITEGIKPMPSFGLLPEQEREMLARYVTYLAIRGEVEFQSLVEQTTNGSPTAIEPFARAKLRELLSEWEKVEHAPAIPSSPDDGERDSETYQTAVRRGYQLFIAKTGTECLKCHGDFGRKPVLRYGIWGTIATPANFTETTLKGGIRPEDVYARIRFGIAPIGMPAHPKLTDREVWDLVRFVRSVPFPRELPKEVRDAVYPNP
jgi:mono/diheme cytochrome c family protein